MITACRLLATLHCAEVKAQGDENQDEEIEAAPNPFLRLWRGLCHGNCALCAVWV